jgi:hypothetical protein
VHSTFFCEESAFYLQKIVTTAAEPKHNLDGTFRVSLDSRLRHGVAR